jgi:hypothetical protein
MINKGAAFLSIDVLLSVVGKSQFVEHEQTRAGALVVGRYPPSATHILQPNITPPLWPRS